MLNSYFYRMKSSRFRFWYSFLLMALLLVKVSSFHVYAHQGEPDSSVEHCSVCDVTLENQQPEIAGEMVHHVILSPVPDTSRINFLPHVSDNSQYSFLRLFGRPPPSLG